jgi:hypothetical protein
MDVVSYDKTPSGMKTLSNRLGLRPDPGDTPARWPQICAVAALIVGLLMSTVSAASANTPSRSKERVTFGIEPASARRADGRPDFSFGVTPGALLHDHVAVVNYSSVPLSLQVYATDAIETSGGGFGLLPATTRPTGAGSWISLPTRFGTVRVPAESAKEPGEVVVPLVIRIPDSAAPGDHVGGVVASLQTVGTNSRGQKIDLIQRVGTRVFIRVAGPLAPKLSVAGLQATYHGTLNPVGQGRVRVSFVVTNSGNVMLGVNQSVSVSGMLGSKRQVALAKVPLLLPGASLHESVTVPGVRPQVRLRATVSALALVPVGVPAEGPTTASTWLWAIPWALIAPVLFVLAAAFAAYRARARRSARRRARAPQVVRA